MSACFRSSFVILVLGLVIVACKPELPPGVLVEGVMTDVLYDYHVAQGMAEVVPNQEGETFEGRRYEYQEAVFRKYGITKAEFDSSMVYYCSDMDLMVRMYNVITDRLEERSQALGLGTGTADMYADLTNTGDTANVWTDRSIIPLKPNPMENLYGFQMACDSTWLVGDELLWRFHTLQFASNGPSRSLTFDLIVNYTNDSIRASMNRLSGNGIAEVRVNNPLGWVPRSVIGHIYLPIYDNDNSPSFYIAYTPALVRFRQPEDVRMTFLPDSIAADTLASDTLNLPLDSLQESLPSNSQLGDSSAHRLSPDEFRDLQPIDRRINPVKQKPYDPSRRRRRRK